MVHGLRDADDRFDTFKRVQSPEYTKRRSFLGQRFDDGEIAPEVDRLAAHQLQLEPFENRGVLHHVMSMAN